MQLQLELELESETQIGIYMQVHGMVEARTHIIIDYNRNGIVNQIALNGTDFKMGFIIAGVGAGALAAAPARLHWFSSSSRQQLPLSVATAAAAAVDVVVVEVTFNAIIYEFIFFAPPNRTLNAVWPDQTRTRPEQNSSEQSRARQRTGHETDPTQCRQSRPWPDHMPGLFSHSLPLLPLLPACLPSVSHMQTNGPNKPNVRIFYGAANPIPSPIPTGSPRRTLIRHRSRIAIGTGNGIAIAIGFAIAIGIGIGIGIAAAIAIAIAIAIRFLALSASISLLCRRRRRRRSFNVGQLKLELSVVRHVLLFMSYGATLCTVTAYLYTEAGGGGSGLSVSAAVNCCQGNSQATCVKCHVSNRTRALKDRAKCGIKACFEFLC